tara:strand:+ start:6797 stop:7183 length:387 start_codon:yes stop_codon:yes gene_type:complete
MDNTQFFYRNVIFTRSNDQISLVDINLPDKVMPLDKWLGTVVSLADGHHTIQQLIDYMGAQYREVPENLEQTLHSVIKRLEEDSVIQLSKRFVSLPYYLILPLEELDIEKAKKMIIEDAYDSSLMKCS